MACGVEVGFVNMQINLFVNQCQYSAYGFLLLSSVIVSTSARVYSGPINGISIIWSN